LRSAEGGGWGNVGGYDDRVAGVEVVRVVDFGVRVGDFFDPSVGHGEYSVLGLVRGFLSCNGVQWDLMVRNR
jgi:hypothetical protein